MPRFAHAQPPKSKKAVEIQIDNQMAVIAATSLRRSNPVALQNQSNQLAIMVDIGLIFPSIGSHEGREEGAGCLNLSSLCMPHLSGRFHRLPARGHIFKLARSWLLAVGRGAFGEP